MLTIGPTTIGGDRLTDDYVVKEDGYGCGRIRYDTGPNNTRYWSWHVNPPLPVSADYTGTAATLEDAKEQFKAAWARFRAALTERDVAYWHEMDNGVRERFGRT